MADPPRIRRGFLGPRRTLLESAAGPLEFARKVHPADPPEVRLKSARIRADLPRVRGGLKSAHLIADYVNIIGLLVLSVGAF